VHTLAGEEMIAICTLILCHMLHHGHRSWPPRGRGWHLGNQTPGGGRAANQDGNK